MAEPGPRLASMIREALPCKGLLQVVCACRGGVGPWGRHARRWRAWRRRVGLRCGSRGIVHRLLRLELAIRASRVGRGRRRSVMGVGDRGRCLISDMLLHLWTTSLGRRWQMRHGAGHTSSATFLYSLSVSCSCAFDESSLGPTENRRAAATLRIARRTYRVEAHVRVSSPHNRE